MPGPYTPDLSAWPPLGQGVHVVYHLCAPVPGVDPEEELAHVYVGVTSNLRSRLRRHSRRWWWPLVHPDLSELEVYPTRQEAERAEADLLDFYQPTCNRVGIRGFRL